MEFKGWKFEHFSEGKLASESFKDSFSKLKFPTMSFPDNFIRISLGSQFFLNINCINLLSTVGESSSHCIPASVFWKKEQERLHTMKYDWAFEPRFEDLFSKFVPSEDQIDYKKLTDTSLPILYYAQVLFIEDELDDNGLVQIEAKLRVMDFGFFLILNHSLRIDRENSTFEKCYRLYHEFESNHLLFQINNEPPSQINI
jgi:hypothetical protein